MDILFCLLAAFFGFSLAETGKPLLRLVGGINRCVGRVEVYHQRQWGTVCDDDWDLKDAQVVCRELKCGTALRAYPGAFFGLGTGRIWLYNVNCKGTELSLTECHHPPWGRHDCLHDEDASVVCSAATTFPEDFTPPTESQDKDETEERVTFQATVPPTAATTFLEASTSSAVSQDKDETEEIPTFQATVPRIDQNSVRLVGGQDRCSGRIEIFHGSQWGTVCDDEWDLRDATVACRQLGCGAPLSVYRKAKFGQGTGPIWLDDVHCTGLESSLAECRTKPWGISNCKHMEDAGLVCSGGKILTLVNGPGRCAGRVEVFYENVWGTVCDDLWGLRNAEVVCRQMGCGSALFAPGNAFFGEGKGPIWLDNVNCTGQESSITDCASASWGVHNCRHGEDAGVVCSDGLSESRPSLSHDPVNSEQRKVPLQRLHSTLASSPRGDISAAPSSPDQTPSQDNRAVEEETLGTFLQTIRSDWMGQTPPSKVETSDKSSSVEEETLGTFLQTIRSDWMGQTPPSKVENSDKSSSVSSFHQPIPSASEPPLSYVPSGCNKESSTGSQYASLGSSSSPVKQPITGSLETTHLDAPEDSNTYSPTGDTQELPNVWTTQSAVTSTDESPEVIRVRLADGPGRCAGRVEVYHKQQWGTVCDDGWNMPDAQVVCQELGCGLAVSFTKWYGPGSGPIWKDEVSCYGFESSLLQCNSEQWGIHDCEHSEDAGVLCEEFSFHQATPSTSEPALTYAPSAWTKESSTVPQYGSHGNSSPPVQRPITRSTDSSHGDAPEDPNTYSPAVDAQELSKAWTTQPTVVSSNQSPEALWVRLAGGPSHCAGRVEIYHNQQWGSVCNDGWNMLDAQVVCQELGCGLAVSVSQWYGPGSGPIWKDEISCYGFESSLMQCNSEPWGSHDCDHSEDAGVHCEGNTSKPEMAGNTTVLTTHEPLASEQVTKSESPSFPEGPSRPSEPQDTCPQHQSKDDACEPKQMPELVKILREMQKDFSSITHPLERNQQQLTSIANSLQDVALSLRRLLEIAPLLTSPGSRGETPQTPTGMPSGTPSQ